MTTAVLSSSNHLFYNDTEDALALALKSSHSSERAQRPKNFVVVFDFLFRRRRRQVPSVSRRGRKAWPLLRSPYKTLYGRCECSRPSGQILWAGEVIVSLLCCVGATTTDNSGGRGRQSQELRT